MLKACDFGWWENGKNFEASCLVQCLVFVNSRELMAFSGFPLIRLRAALEDARNQEMEHPYDERRQANESVAICHLS